MRGFGHPIPRPLLLSSALFRRLHGFFLPRCRSIATFTLTASAMSAVSRLLPWLTKSMQFALGIAAFCTKWSDQNASTASMASTASTPSHVQSTFSRGDPESFLIVFAGASSTRASGDTRPKGVGYLNHASRVACVPLPPSGAGTRSGGPHRCPPARAEQGPSQYSFPILFMHAIFTMGHPRVHTPSWVLRADRICRCSAPRTVSLPQVSAP